MGIPPIGVEGLSGPHWGELNSVVLVLEVGMVEHSADGEGTSSEIEIGQFSWHLLDMIFIYIKLSNTN